ncbi:MAG TPA: ATP-binding cassette domain-containing protein [Gaiellaceae bacterium]|jgi:simple sugar transport system ATP-binding protein|nr:ATP-binding cassette domain-containing protein [Gaiellaceae bacterium]
MGSNGTPLVEARGIAKNFGRIEALKNVSFTLGPAEVLGLLGDNGAGKSTLIKILTGLFPPDKGEIRWAGEPVRFGSPRDAYDIGVATVYQDLAIVDLMSIYRNVFLGREKAITKGFGPFRWIDRKKAHHDAREAISDIGIEIRDAEEPLARMSGGERQSIAIARAAYFNPKLLILDEPTSALSLRQTKRVLKSVEEARNKGISIIFITHNVYHVYPIADRFVILSHGESIAEFAKGAHSRDEVAELIVTGKEHARKLGYHDGGS